MMLKLFMQKEKANLFFILIYLYFLFVFFANIIDPSEADYSTGIIGFYIWGELLHVSPFSLTSYFKNNHENKFGKPNYYSLDTNLRMLSIPFNKFLKYNIVYNLIKLLPFLVLLLIFGKTSDDYLTFIIFALFVGLFSILNPINTKYIGPLLKIRVDNIFEDKKDVNVKINDYFRDMYPSRNGITIRIARILYVIGFGMAYIGVRSIQDNIQSDYLLIISYVAGIIGVCILVFYTIYFTTMVLGTDNEI